MPRYHYTAIAMDGKKAKGSVTAETSYAARKQLRVRGIHPTSVSEIKPKSEARSLSSILHRSSKKQMVDFTREMSTLLNSGIKLTEALSVLRQQTTDVGFKNALTDIHQL